MEENKVYWLLALTAIVSIVFSVGAFTVMKTSFTGPQGEQGIQGIQGEQGIQGIPGEMGPAHVCEEVQRKYDDLLAVVNMTVIDDYSQTIEYNISAGTDRTWEFLIPEYGIVWEAKIRFSGAYIWQSHAYNIEDRRIFVGSSGNELNYMGFENRENVWGTIKVEYYLTDDPHRIRVVGHISTNLLGIQREGDAYVYIP